MLLSIIVPVYNVEDYIEECVGSLLKINIENMEIIIINDGCKDSSINKINKFIDPRIKVIEINENKGVSASRNLGMKSAKGEFIYFIDSDDYIMNQNVIYRMIELAKKNDLDCVMGNGYYYWKNDKKRKIYYGDKSPKKEIIENIDEYIIDSLKNNYYQDMVWLNIYKRSMIVENNIFFLEGYLHEDVDWMLQFLLRSKRIGYINEVFYIYRQRDGSITKSNDNKLKLSEDKIYIANLINKYSDRVESLELKNVLKGRATELYFSGAISGRSLNKKFFKQISKMELNERLYAVKLRKWIKLYKISPEITYSTIKLITQLKRGK